MKLASVFVVLPIVLLAAPLSAQDDILMHDGRDITNVRIQHESVDKVEYKKGSRGTSTVETADVREIRYGRTSPEFVKAVELRDKGSMLQAAEYFAAAESDPDLPDHIRATALVEAADALVVDNSLADALGVYKRFLSDYPSSRHLPRALLGQGKAMIFSGRSADAVGVLDTLKQETSSKGLDERWGLEADYFKLFAQEAQGKDVIDGYTQLRTRTQGDYQGIANKCALRMGRVHHASRRHDAAEGLFNEIITSRLDTDADIVAAAFTGRGRIAFDRGLAAVNSGDNDEALEHFRDAQLDFLRVYVNYRGVRREQPEAMYWAGEAFLNVGSLSNDKDANTWGLIMLKRCRESFPKSEWGQKAAQSR